VCVLFDLVLVVAADVVEVELEDLVDVLVVLADFVAAELVVVAAALVDDDAAALVAGGGITLKLTVAPHSARVRPLSQHPASVQYVPAEQ